MISRVAWLAAGAVAGAYATVKGRRAAYRLSPPGVIDQVAAAGAGWREFRTEMITGMTARENDLTSRLEQAPAPRDAIESDLPKDHP
ncbi:DUF6167 family protein [Aeromicrobium sp. CF3.5]|uniref:DUF6167 family protein n=1 Tax=Aeromicrobium sp. CF3.5 TaxID=3373078 RepID=UPI003EE6B671